MTLTNDRMNHCLSVAKKMKELVQKDPERYNASPEEAFTIGILHDIGYEFSDEQRVHASNGGLILKMQGYKYWKEIFYHGSVQSEYTSPELWLLNYVDMITGPTGDYTTAEDRIDDISLRYGTNSWQTKEALALYKKLQEEGWL